MRSSGEVVGSGSSPHTRGALIRSATLYEVSGIIPAYAGSTFNSVVASSSPADHPRIRGEHAVFFSRVRIVRIIPAYAGSTSTRCRRTQRRKDHPRIRGEHIQDTPLTNVTPGSSPHTRGAPPGWRRSPARRRIIPAYAGSTMAAYRLDLMTQDHPRIRGEHATFVPSV